MTPSELARRIDLRVARRIRERRRVIGMTQQKLAQLIGVAFQQAHKYERGLSRISAGRLYHIAAALQAPITYFFADEAGGDRDGRPKVGE
jgi:transcriptional regulator with XRE-family HTH domain